MKLSTSFRLNYFFISLAIYTQVASAPLILLKKISKILIFSMNCSILSQISLEKHLLGNIFVFACKSSIFIVLFSKICVSVIQMTWCIELMWCERPPFDRHNLLTVNTWIHPGDSPEKIESKIIFNYMYIWTRGKCARLFIRLLT